MFNENAPELKVENVKGLPPEGDVPAGVADARTKKPEGETQNTDTPAEGAGDKPVDTPPADKPADDPDAKAKAEQAEADRLQAKATELGKTVEEVKALEAGEAKAKEDQDAKAKIESEALAMLFKEFGVSSKEELREKMKPKVELTEEQKKQQAEMHQTNMLKYALDNKMFTRDEWILMENLRKMPDDVLAYNDFANSYKEDNKGRVDADNKPDPITDDEIRDKFNEQFHIESTNEAAKKRGERQLSLIAKELRSPLEAKYQDVKEIYEDDMMRANTVPAFRNFMQSILSVKLPEKLDVGEGDQKIVYDLSKLDKEAFEHDLIKDFGNEEFEQFLSGKGTAEQRARIEKRVDQSLWYLIKDGIIKEAINVGDSAGQRKSATGRNQPFNEGKGQAAKTKIGGAVAPEDQEVIRKSFA